MSGMIFLFGWSFYREVCYNLKVRRHPVARTSITKTGPQVKSDLSYELPDFGVTCLTDSGMF